MNKKISLGLSISLIVMAATISFAITTTVSRQMFNKLIIDLPNRVEQYEVVADVDNLIRSNYYIDINMIDQNILNNSLAAGYMKGLNDPNCSFMTAEEYKTYARILEGKFSGSGITHILSTRTGYMLITSITANSPATNKGLQVGDEIMKINKETVTKKTYDELAKELEGYKLKTIDITFRRKGQAKNISIQLGASSQSVFYKTINSIGYVKITAFYKNTLGQFNKAISALENQGVKSVIFDVRNNSDGDIKYAADVIDAIVPVASEGTGAIVTLIDKDGKTETFSSDSNTINMKMAVLINAKTSGCAEVFAQDLKDFKGVNVLLIGEKTAGNWTKQEVLRLQDGNYIKMTTAKMLPYITDTKDTGIEPEFAISLITESENNFDQPDLLDDPQISAAYDKLVPDDGSKDAE